MVKDDFHKTRALCSDCEEISIAKDSELFVMLYKLQEEVHRFTVSKMDAAKRKTLTHSSLTKIKGIGDAKAKLLLSRFGGLAGVRAATAEELESVRTVSRADAENIRKYFDKKRK
jgi:excinuclease ABC subunit C